MFGTNLSTLLTLCRRHFWNISQKFEKWLDIGGDIGQFWKRANPGQISKMEGGKLGVGSPTVVTYIHKLRSPRGRSLKGGGGSGGGLN